MDIDTGNIVDTYSKYVWEPAVVKVMILVGDLVDHTSVESKRLPDSRPDCRLPTVCLQINAITAATEAACLILSVDETIKNPKVSHLTS